MIEPPDRAATAGADARRRIENAALKLFAERPAEAVRLDEIAAPACSSLTTIYRHYGDKQTLLAVCALGWADRLAERMIDHLTAVRTPKDRLRKVFRVVLDFFRGASGCPPGWCSVRSIRAPCAAIPPIPNT